MTKTTLGFVLAATLACTAGCGDDGKGGGSPGGSGGSGGSNAGTGGNGGNGGIGGDASVAGTGGNGGIEGDASVAGTGGDASVAGSGGDGGVPQEPECTTENDCRVEANCGQCLALAIGEEPPVINVPQCEDDACTRVGLEDVEAACVAGECVLDVSCDDRNVTCERLPPDCDEGELAVVEDDCWIDACIPVAQCREVRDCDDCGEEQACVEHSAWGSTTHCVDVYEACTDGPTCDCMGEGVCRSISGVCNEIDTGLACTCISC